MKIEMVTISFLAAYTAAAGHQAAQATGEAGSIAGVALAALCGGLAVSLLSLRGKDLTAKEVINATMSCMVGVLVSAFMTDWAMEQTGWFVGHRLAAAFLLSACGAPLLAAVVDLPFRKIIMALLPNGGSDA